MASPLIKIRERWITAPIFKWARSVLPRVSETERAAIEAGNVWWDGELFSGRPEWEKLLHHKPSTLTAEEQAFLDGPTETLCKMLDDWQINHEEHDLPPEVWAYIKQQRFFGMIIPKDYGGLGFSPSLHSEVVRKLSTASIVASVTVMVPNSLGPGELLYHFGTPEQKRHYLPRLADGREIPCFGLTSTEAGSDAGAMHDHGIVSWGEYKGERVLGLKLNWSKRYITLCPVATIIGLAVKVYDPDHHLGAEAELGITVVLVPADTAGVVHGRRHLPAGQVFQNGPTQGKDVFLPLDAVVGGRVQIGQGWKMLMSALAAGRGISLPSLSAGGAAHCARVSGAYARIREQFGLSIAKFEGVSAPLGRIAGLAYQIDAARRLTCSALDQGHKPAVIAAIMKCHATEKLRVAINDAMDIHGGRAVMDGPRNYLGNVYRSLPVAITVEGANILTRNLMIFGQGAIRCHPYLLAEMDGLGDENRKRGLEKFDRVFWAHVGHALSTMARSFFHSWTKGCFAASPPFSEIEHHAKHPPKSGRIGRHYRQLSRYACVLSTLSDLALLLLGGALKRKESLSARLGDILSELYMLSAVLKRFEDEGRHEADHVLVEWCMAEGLKNIEAAIDGVIANFPSRAAAHFMRFIVPHDSRNRKGASDQITQACARLITHPSEARDRLTVQIFKGRPGSGVVLVETAFQLVAQAEPIERRLHEAHIRSWRLAEAQKILTTKEHALLEKMDAAVHEALLVDDFSPEEIGARAVARAPVSQGAS